MKFTLIVIAVCLFPFVIRDIIPPCPLTTNCQSNLNNWVDTIPLPKIKKIIPTKEIFTLIVENKKNILFFKKPPKGIWGGLWAFPEFDQLPSTQDWLSKNLQAKKYTVENKGETSINSLRIKFKYQFIKIQYNF